MRAYTYTEPLQRGKEYASRRDERRRYPAGEVPSAAIVLIAVIFAEGGVIRVRGTGGAVIIVFAARVLVRYNDAYGRSGGFSVKNAAEYLKLVLFLSGRVQRRGGTAAGKPACDEVPAHRDARRKPVDDSAHSGAVALAEKAHRNALSESVLHVLFSKLPRISSGLISQMRN